jgi:hypothetical protein
MDMNREARYLAMALRRKIATGTLSRQMENVPFHNRDLALFCQGVNEAPRLPDGCLLSFSIHSPVALFLHRKLLDYRDSLFRQI